MELSELLAHMRAAQASDLHLVVGQKPVFRVAGRFERRDQDPVLDAHAMEALVMPHLSERHRQTLAEARRDADLTVSEGGRRFRMHVLRDRNGLAAALRAVPNRVPTLDELEIGESSGLPLANLTKLTRGLVVVTGPTGSGKSTLCAAMLEEINRTRAERIVTVEDPIEYEFESKLSLISQRSVGEDISDYPAGLRAALYMDPDVIYVDRLRDLETTMLALSLAETGHLVFVTLSVPTVSEAVQRIADSFPEGQRPVIRDMLSRNLQAVVAQMLLPRAGGAGRVPAHEILIGAPRVRQLVAAGVTDFGLAMEAGRGVGMQTFDDALLSLYARGAISQQIAVSRMSDRGRMPAPAPDESVAAA